MEILKTNSVQESQNYVNSCLGSHEGCVIHTNNSINILTGQLNTYNKDVVQKYNYEIGVGKYKAGTIVNFPNDVSVCITSQKNISLAPDLVKLSSNWLIGKNIPTIAIGNDILVKGKKVISWGRAKYNDWYQSVIHYSIGEINLDLISEICLKPIRKIPGSLGDYGVTSEEIINLIEPIIANA